MKRRKKRKYKFKNILLFIIAILFFYYAICTYIKIYDKKDSQFLNKLKNESNIELTKDKEKIIIKYMDEYFRSMTTLKERNMKFLFSNKSKEEAYINQTAISTLVNIRKLERNDMRINNGKYDIIIKDIQKNKGLTTITFLENDYLHFNFMKNIESRVYDIENTIVLNKDNKIIKFRKTQDFYVMITNKYEESKSLVDAKKQLDKIKNNHIKDYKEQINLWNQYQNEFKNNLNKPEKTCDNKYDRDKALQYSKKYVLNKNKDWFDYATIGGNCQNYSSQVLYAGGIPMDVIGDPIEQWKNYSEELDETNYKIGRSSSWTSVQNFYEYAKYNNGFGLCSSVNINPFYAEDGDIGQVGYDKEFRHSVVIIGNIKDKKGNILDLLINSNSVNLVNYPLSGYVYPYKRIIKIHGYND